jgi:formylmethanofuran dehydrogenase subunit A
VAEKAQYYSGVLYSWTKPRYYIRYGEQTVIISDIDGSDGYTAKTDCIIFAITPNNLTQADEYQALSDAFSHAK